MLDRIVLNAKGAIRSKKRTAMTEQSRIWSTARLLSDLLALSLNRLRLRAGD